MIAVVDYHKGNLLSVERGLRHAGAEDAVITDNAAAIACADAIVLPGVGAFADAAATMEALGQTAVIRDRVAAGVPFLGICLGMHLMFEEGTEGAPEEDDEESTHNARGLAILPGVVDRLPRTDAAGAVYKIPHVGWNTVWPAGQNAGSDEVCSPSALCTERNSPVYCSTECELPSDRVYPAGAPDAFTSPLFDGIMPGEYFYFTHSYAAPTGPFVTAVTCHSIEFPCAVQYGQTAFGVQFHPEKSSDAGVRLLRNFVSIAKGA